MKGKFNNENRHRLYANNAPRILLEVLSARATLVILATTYIVFILAFVYDVKDTIQNFGGADIHLSSEPCMRKSIDMDSAWTSDGEWGCTIDMADNSKMWIGRVNNVSNVISVGLRYVRHNISAIQLNGTDIEITEKTTKSMYLQELEAYSMKYHVSLLACHQRSGCKHSSNSMRNEWQHVLAKTHQRVTADAVMSEDMQEMAISLFGNTFQNQESLPTKSSIKSYLIFVQYWGNFNMMQPDSTDDTVVFEPSGEENYFEFISIQRPRSTIGDVMRPVLMVITLVMAVYYVNTLHDNNPKIHKWLHERKWIMFYFFVLLLYQNPIYCIICHVNNPPSFWIFASYALDAFAQASFFLIWLLFADGLRRQYYFYRFYLPKIFIAVLIYSTNMAILIMQFPSVDHTTTRTPFLAVYNWSKDTKVMFIAFSLSFFLLLMIWSLWWFASLWSTAIVLRKVPYMTTRYLQLSFRFFALQATFVATYYVLEYGVVIYLILRNSPPMLTQRYYNISDNINTLFRHQTLLVGKVLFLSVYSLILAFLFLPATHMDSASDSLQTLATTYTITEEEMEAVSRARRRIINSTKALSNLAHAKAEVYCVSLAQQMFDASYEVYYDLPGTETPSGFGPADWARHGYQVIGDSYDTEFDAYCCIVRHLRTNRIVVAFRGTCSSRHWHNNLQYGLKAVDINSLYMPHIDDGDGLDVGQYIDLTVDGVDVDELDSPLGDQFPARSSSDPMSIMTGTLRGVMGATKGVVVGATETVVGATTTVVGATTDILTAAVAHTPGINRTVKTYVHSGFYDTFFVLREFIHRTLRNELSESPGQVIFTGHSLGGAMATFAALDFSVHSLPRINKYIRYRKLSQTMYPAPTRRPLVPLIDVTVANYTFGAPKNGNWMFAKIYEKLVPNTFRTVVDGDIVCGLPPTWSYRHVGTEVLVDPLGAGSVIIDPSFVERRLRTSVRSSISVHAMSVYKTGIDGVHDASTFLQKHSMMTENDGAFDSLRLALTRGPVKSTLSASREWDALDDNSWHDHVALRPFEVLNQDSSFHSAAYGEVGKNRDENREDADDGRKYDEEWGYEMDVSYRGDVSNGESRAAMEKTPPLSPIKHGYASPTGARDLDGLNDFSRMALSVEIESDNDASLSPLLDLTVSHVKKVASFVVGVPTQLLQNMLVRVGIQTMDEQEIKDMMTSSVPRRVVTRTERPSGVVPSTDSGSPICSHAQTSLWEKGTHIRAPTE